jgi:hypothetical protein
MTDITMTDLAIAAGLAVLIAGLFWVVKELVRIGLEADREDREEDEP